MQLKTNLQPFNAKLAYTLVSLIALGYLAVLAKDILSPLIFSLLFAIVLLPLATFFETKLKLPRSAAAMVTVLVLIAAILLVFYTVGSQISTLASDWPMFKQQLIVSIDNLQHWVADRFNIDAAKQLNYVNDATTKLMASGTAVLGATVLSLSGILLFLVFTFIYTFFMLLYRKHIMRFFIAVFSDDHASVVHQVIEQIQYIIRKYIVGLLLQMAIVSSVCCLAFWILGIKYAILLGLITGLFNIIPYIGIFTALLISMLITFATAVTVGKVLVVLAVIVIMHLIDSNVLLPIIVGSKVKINALITVLGVIIGEHMWGISGMFLSIPVIAVAKIVFDKIEDLKPWGALLGDEEKAGLIKAKIFGPDDPSLK